MKESYKEELAIHLGLEPYAVDGNIESVASARGSVGQLLSSDILTFACRSHPVREKATSSMPHYGKVVDGRGGVREPGHAWTFQVREPGDPIGFFITSVGYHGEEERSVNVPDGTADMNANRKSDDSIVPAKWTNKTRTLAAESVEERGSLKGNLVRFASSRTQGRTRRTARTESVRLVEIIVVLTVTTQERSRMR